MKPDTKFLAGTMTILSAMLDKDSRTKLASTSFALHDLLRPSLKLKGSAVQENLATLAKGSKKARWTSKVLQARAA